MSDVYTDLLVRSAKAVDAACMSEEETQATDEGHSTPEIAARHAWDASSLLRDLGRRYESLADEFMFAGRRFDKAQQREMETGVEHRGGEAA